MTSRLPSAKHPKMKPGVPKPKRPAPGEATPFRAKKSYKPSDDAGAKPARRPFERTAAPRDREATPYRAGERDAKPFRSSDRDSKPYRSHARDDKPFRPKRSFDSAPRDERSSAPRPPYARDAAPRSDKPYGERKPYARDAAPRSDKPYGERKSYVPRDAAPRSDRPYGERKPYARDAAPRSDRPYGERKSYAPRDAAPRGDRPYGERKPYVRAGESRPSERRPFSPSGPPRDRPASRATGDRDAKPFRKPWEDRGGDKRSPRSDERSSRPRTYTRSAEPKREFGRTPRDGARSERGSYARSAPRSASFAPRPRREFETTESPALPAKLSPRQDGYFRIYGRRPVLELLKLGLAVRVDLPRSAHGRIIDEIKQYVNAQKLDLRIIESVDTEDEAADEVADHDVCAYAPPPAIRGDLKIFLRSLTEESSGIILMLDGVLDPHNYGAILRTAAAAGVRAVIARDRRQAPLSEVVVKASAGMAYLVPIFEVTNLSAAMRELVEAGFWTVASARATQATPFQEFDWKRKLCLILGSEGKGVSQLVRESADNVVAIPLAEAVDSLNVSVAAGVLLFEAMRQQKENVVVADA